MRLAAALVLAVLVLVVPGAALAATPRTTLPDVEDEVMCVECGTALNVSTSPVANQERELIRRLIARGETKAEIKAKLVDTYGQNVLAEPSDSGIGLAAWWIPVVLAPLGLLVALLAARRWRRRNAAAAAAPGAAVPGPLAEADARRLDAELSAFDR
jgi:cytochrome c-type biogenesis protein CcmH/NrfF